MDVNNVNVNLIRGHMDTIILRTLQNQDKYGLEMLNEIKELSDNLYSLKQPTLYNSLKRLEKQGLITSYPGDVSNGANRTYYSLTDDGRAFLEVDQKEWEFSRSIIDKLLSDKGFDINGELPFNTADFRPLTKRTASDSTVEVEKIIEVEKVIYKYLHPITHEELSEDEYYRVTAEIKENIEKTNAFQYNEVEQIINRNKTSDTRQDNIVHETVKNNINTAEKEEKSANYQSQNKVNVEQTTATKSTLNLRGHDDNFFNINEYDFLFEQNSDETTDAIDAESFRDSLPFGLKNDDEDNIATNNNKTQSLSQNDNISAETTAKSINEYYNTVYQDDETVTTTPIKTVDDLIAPYPQADTKDNIVTAAVPKSKKINLYEYDSHIDFDKIESNETSFSVDKNQSGLEFMDSIFNQNDNQFSSYTDNSTQIFDNIKSDFDFKKLKDELTQDNVKLKIYDKASTIDYYTNKFCYINRMFRDFSIVLFVFFNVFLYSMFLSLGALAGIGLSGVLITSGISLLLPIIALLNYLHNPTKRIRSNLSLGYTFLSSLIFVIAFTIITVIIGFFIISINITEPSDYIPTIVMPITSSLFVPFGVMLYNFLYNTKHYRVG